MKELIGRLFFRFGLAGLGLIAGGRAMAQNYTAWPVTHVSAGFYHTMFMRSDGTLYVMGDNSYGQLGLPTFPDYEDIPQPLTNGVGLFSCGGSHSMFAIGRGLWVMGENGNGQLGDGGTLSAHYPEQVGSVGTQFRYNALSAGDNFSQYGVYDSLTGSGSLQAMGGNEYGQLGNNSTNEEHTAQTVLSYTVSNPRVTVIATGAFHTLFVKSDGSLWAMGDNEVGQLGDNSLISKDSAVQIEPNGVVSVAAGFYFSLFIKSDGSLWAMGDNHYGQLGDGTTTTRQSPIMIESNVVAVAAGDFHSLFIRSDGSLWGMGNDTYGQLGINVLGDQGVINPVEIVASNVVAIAGGYGHSLFVKSDGSLWGLGENSSGQLGTGDLQSRFTPTEIVSPRPQITLILYGPNVILAWPTNAAGFTLQSATNLTPPAVWTTVSPAPLAIGGQFEVINPASGPACFYRLSQ